MPSTGRELARVTRRFETPRKAQPATRANRPAASGVTWFASHDVRTGGWTAEGIDTDGRRSGLIAGLDGPPRRSPDGERVVAVSAAAGVETRLTTFDASDGRLIDQRAAHSPFPRGAGDLDVETAISADGGTVAVVLTAVAHRPVAIVDKPDPDGGADEVAVGPWEIRRALQVFGRARGRVPTMELPVQPRAMVAARLSLAGDAVVIDSAVARPMRGDGTKARDAGFDAVRTTWRPLGGEPPQSRPVDGSTCAISGNAVVLSTTAERQVRLVHGRVLLIDDWSDAPPRQLALGLRAQAACMVDDRRVVLSADNGRVAIVDVSVPAKAGEVALPGGAYARGTGAITIDSGTHRIFVATTSGIWVLDAGALRVVDCWQPHAPFELVSTRGERILAKVDGAPVLLVLDGDGTARAVGHLRSRNVRPLA